MWLSNFYEVCIVSWKIIELVQPIAAKDNTVNILVYTDRLYTE